MDPVFNIRGLATTGIVGKLTLTKTGTTARTVTFPDAAITVARTDAAQTFTGQSTFTDGILTTHCDAATSAGVHIGNVTHQDVAIFGAGSGQGTTLYGQLNCLAILATGVITAPNGTAAAPGLRITSEASGLYRSSGTALGFAVAGVAAATLTNDRIFTVGANTGYAVIAMDGAAGNVLAFRWQRNAQRRWDLVTSGAAESGGNAGSDYSMSAYSDTGVLIDTPLSIARAAGGAFTIARPVVLSVATTAGTVAGTFQRETNQDNHYTFANGIGGWLDKCIFSQYASVTQSGIVTSQSLASATARGTRTLPANFYKQGKVMRFRLCGRYTTDVAPGNATIDIKLGSTTFRTTGSYALDASVTNLPWEIEGEITCYTTGATGTVEGVAWWAHGVTGATANFDIESMAGTGTVTIDTTAAQAFDVQWTATDAGTAITCTCFRMWEVC